MAHHTKSIPSASQPKSNDKVPFIEEYSIPFVLKKKKVYASHDGLRAALGIHILPPQATGQKQSFIPRVRIDLCSVSLFHLRRAEGST